MKEGKSNVESIRFADEVVLPAETEELCNKILKHVKRKCEEYGMRINKGDKGW